MKSSCEDYSFRPIWSYVVAKGYKAGVFEGEKVDGKNSILQAKKCGQDPFLDGLRIWKMDAKAPKKAKLFHREENTEFKTDEVYYDRSCLSGDCFSTLSGNIEKTFETFSRNAGNYLYIVRDFQYLNRLKQGNVLKAKEEFAQLEKVVRYFQEIAKKRNDFLLLVTSSGGRHAEFPKQGKAMGGV